MMRLVPVAAAVAGYFALAVSPALCADAASVNDTARYLAGMPPSANSPLTPLTKSAYWQEHARTMDRAFAQVEKTTLAPAREWLAAHLTSPRPAMFYMFSGPDFLFADALFPKATTYVLAALEPIGDIPDILKQQRNGETVGLGQLQTAMRTLLSISFFITKEMRGDISESSLRGTIPILYVFLARSGKQVRSTSLVYVDAQGDVHPEAKNSKSGAHGVKIVFAGADGGERTLYYFTTNLDNVGARTSGFLKFLDKLGPADSFHKSASYLMHKNEFSRIRDFRTTAASRSAIWTRRSGSCGRSAATSSRSIYSRKGASRRSASCSKRAVPASSISASAIAGGRASRTCCWRSNVPGLKRPTTGKPLASRRRR